MGARSFRVELLHAESLPLHLLASLNEMLESPDPLVRRAAENHFRHLSEEREFIRSINIQQKVNELRTSNRELEWRRVREWNRQKLEEANYIAWQIESYSETYGLLNDSFFSLVALGFFASDSDRENILDSLNGHTWATKHEILTRWGWMCTQRELLEKGERLANPYSCVVAHRGDVGRGADKEFHSLLTFLHLLRAVTGRELLFFSKDQTPDFILEDEQGEKLGAEMTETSISSMWDSEHDAEREVIKAIVSRLGTHFVTLKIVSPVSWQEVRDKLSELESWLSAEIESIGPVLKDRISLSNHDLGLAIELIPSDEQLQWTMLSRIPVGAQAVEEVCQTLKQRLHNKIRKGDGSLKKLPSIRPCYLVFYPNYDLGVDVDDVIREFRRHSPIDVGSHFDEVWIASERYLDRLI